ncbi:uncharacterized protein LOC143040067 isoform X2 [Oratosquilla oratoria]|uniref:uncharacterized protein LOC143040067 isoform X2 n=1 Tax=Oratosquilla oratoria TaxID=337810 RepID=UPI003F765ABB
MPLRNEPHSLERCAMLCIAHHFDHICYGCTTRVQIHRMLEDESFLEVEGPFVSLPGNVLSKMLSLVLERSGHVHRQHLHVLMQDNLDELKLKRSNAHMGVGMLCAGRCQKLRRLDLSYVRIIRPHVLLDLLPLLRHLTSLNLTYTETVDHVLEKVGRHCPELRELNISQCNVSDRGIQRLCYNADERQPQCRHLVSLKTAGSSVTARGIAFLLQKCPKVADLDFDRIFEVFDVLESSGETWQETADGRQRSYQLLALTSAAEFASTLSVDLACALCPRTQTVTLSNAIVSSEVLYKFMALNHLAHLQLTNSEGMALDFLEGVVPLLTVKGHQLVSLLLSNFAFVDVGAIGECCPRLQNLALSEVLLFDEIGYPRENIFTELRALELWADPSPTYTTLSPVILQQLLAFCRGLRKLLLRSVVAINDKLFLQILEHNPMEKLSRLTLDGCPNMSALSLHALLSSTNDLILLRIWSCFLIGKDHQEELQRRVVEENCNVNLDWFPWEG